MKVYFNSINAEDLDVIIKVNWTCGTTINSVEWNQSHGTRSSESQERDCSRSTRGIQVTADAIR